MPCAFQTRSQSYVHAGMTPSQIKGVHRKAAIKACKKSLRAWIWAQFPEADRKRGILRKGPGYATGMFYPSAAAVYDTYAAAAAHTVLRAQTGQKFADGALKPVPLSVSKSRAVFLHDMCSLEHPLSLFS